MPRIALHGILREGAEAGYDRAHRIVPPELLAMFERVGIRDWVIWRSGRDVFHVLDCDDFERAVAMIAADPANEAWQREMAPYVESMVANPDGTAGLALRQVWALRDQAAADADESG
jgi:L-rhamnose mutarotase